MPILPWLWLPETVSKTFRYKGFLPTTATEGTDQAQMEQVSFIWTSNLFRELRGPTPLSSPPSPFPLPRGTLKVQGHVPLESSAPSLPHTPPHSPALRRGGGV